MPLTARFQVGLTPSNIDAEKWTLTACRIATKGATANTAKENGGGLLMDEEMLAGLNRLGNESGKVDAFLTHDWSKEDSDPLHLDVGYWDNFRRDESGNLIADFHAAPSQHREGLFWRAQNNPASIAVSPLFTYSLRNGDAALANPQRFVSSDFVKWGAINKALFSADPPTTKTMLTPEDKAEIASMISTALAAHKTPDPAPITDIPPEAPALMAAVKAVREELTAEFKKSLDAQKGEVLVAAKAELVGKLGAMGIIQRSGEGDAVHPFVARFNKHKSIEGTSNGTAKARAIKDSSADYNDYMDKVTKGILQPI